MKTRKFWVRVVVCLLTSGVSSSGVQPAVSKRKANEVSQLSSTPITTGETLRIRSKQLGEERKVDIYLPPSFATAQQRYPVVLAKVNFSVPQRPRPWDKVKEVAIGSEAPDWQLKTVAGDACALSALRGQVVVLDFWANWCAPCRKLEPLFDQLAREYQSQSVKFFTLSIWPDQDFNAQVYVKEHKMASTFLLGTDAVARDYGIWGVPTYYVIDPKGKVAFIHVLLSVDREPLEKRLREAIEEALSKEAG